MNNPVAIVPCFACLYIEPLRACKPQDCVQLDEWLNCESRAVHCPQCNSTALQKHGLYMYGGFTTQFYRCKECGIKFSDRPKFGYRMKHPASIVAFAQEMSNSLEPAFSTRDIATEIFKRFQVKVSHVTVNRWLSH